MTAGTRAGWRLLLLPFAALVAVMPLLHHGCSCGHDFDFHVLNWMEAARQLSQGTLHPHWAFTPAFNAGEPRFVFYPPISWYLGALLGLLATHLPGVSEAAAWSAVPIVFTWISLTAAGLSLYRLARLYAGTNAALVAATVYLANPYMLFTAYERTAYAELLAAAWIPLLFEAILRERVRVPRVALPVALLWLTNAPAAVMGSYTLAFLAFVRVASASRNESTAALKQGASRRWAARHRSSIRLAWTTACGAALGLALAAFYLVPAVYERRFVQIAMAAAGGMRIDQNFLFEHTGSSADALLHDQVLHTASTIALLLLAGTAVGLGLASWLKKRQTAALPVPRLGLLAAGIALLLTPFGLPLWEHIPQAMFLQFPWRLLAILAPIFVLGVAAVCERFSPGARSATFAVVLLAILLSHPAYHFFRQVCDAEDTVAARLALFHSNAGTDPTDEYTPANADNDALEAGNPPYWLAAQVSAPPPPGAQAGPVAMRFSVTAPQAEELIVDLRDYPEWQVQVEGQTMQVAARADGLMAVPIPEGRSNVDIRYRTGPDQTLGDAASGLAICALLLTMRKRSATRPGGPVQP